MELYVAPSRVAVTEVWNGTNWTEEGDLSTARSQMGATGHSPASSGLAFGGGNPGPLANTEEWVGSGANYWCLVYRW